MQDTKNMQKGFPSPFLLHMPACAVALLLLTVCLLIAAPTRAQSAGESPTLDQILKEVSVYEGGINSEALWKLRDYLHACKDKPLARADCESKLLEFLKTPAAPSAKMAVCRHLRVIGSDKAVPALQAMISDSMIADASIYALQRIPGVAADKALIQALASASGGVKTALIGALGERGSEEAVPALTSILKQEEFRESAAVALGSIGGAAACNALVKDYAESKGVLKPAIAASMLRCAEKFLEAKNDNAAIRLYEMLSTNRTLTLSLRRAALMGRISASGSGGAKLIMDQLNGSDAGMQEAAIFKIPDAIKADEIDPFCARLPRLPEKSQIQLLAVLAGYPKERVLSSLLQSARSNSAAVRIAAIKALESAGDSTTVALLAETAAKARGPEQSAARRALGSLKGSAVDDAILALLTQKPPAEIQEELLLAAVERQAFSAKSAIPSLLASDSFRLRIQALKSLRALGTPSDIPAVLDLLVKTDQDSEQAEAGLTAAALAQKIINSDGRSNMIKSRLATDKQPAARIRLLGVLPLIGDSSSLPLLREALQNDSMELHNAAVRALASWPTSAARDDVFRLARDSKDETNRLLAIRGLVRIIGLDKYREPEAVVADLKQAAGFAWRPEERKLILSVLVQYPSPDALNLAQGFLSDPALKAEAQAATARIKAQLAAKPVLK